MNTIKNSSAAENSNTVEKTKRKNFFVGLFTNWKQFIVFLLSLLIFPVLLLVYATIIPISDYKPAAEIGANKTQVSVSLDDAQKEDIIKIINLEKERDFEKNRLSLASQDSIYLVINVPERSMAIEIKGVQVRTASILRVESDQKIPLFSHEHTSVWLADPFVLKKYFATIPKIPIVIKDAPKDTIEAQKLSSKPLPPDSTIVLTSLYFDRNLIIEINQDAIPVERELAIVEAYNVKKLEYMPEKTTIEKLLNPGATDMPLTIRLIVSAADARAIYRAIPSRTSLVLKL
jgi:hypothetical protein